MQLTSSESFNGASGDDVPGPEEPQQGDEEQAAIAEAVNRLVLQSGPVGFVGQEGIAEDARLVVDVRRDLSASLVHGLGSALTLFLFPYWVEVTYEVHAELRGVPGCEVGASATDSWYVLVNPFLVFAMPFDEGVRPVQIVEALARSALSEVVARAEDRGLGQPR